MKKVLFTIMALLSIPLFVVGCSNKDDEPTMTIIPTGKTIAVGEHFKLKVKTSDSKAEITFTSEDPSIATVDEKGMVSGVKEGTVKIYAESGSVKKSCDVTVKGFAPKLTVSPTDTTIDLGKAFRLKAEITPSDKKSEITFTSEDPSVAIVNSVGVVRGMDKGTVKINAKSGDLEASCNVTVTLDDDPKLVLSPKDTVIALNTSFQLRAKVIYPKEKSEITFISSDPSIATVDKKGMVSGVKEGKVKINAESGNLKESCYLEVRKFEKMEVEIVDINSTSATVKMTPPAEDMMYQCIINNIETYNNIIKIFGSVPTGMKAFWAQWGEFAQDYIREFSFKGSQTQNSWDIRISGGQFIFLDDHDYVLTAYGHNNDGTEITEVLTIPFKTKPRVKDPDFKIDVKIKNASADALSIIIEPSDMDKQYFVDFVRKDFADEVRMRKERGETIKDIPAEYYMCIFGCMNPYISGIGRVHGEEAALKHCFKCGKFEIKKDFLDIFEGTEVRDVSKPKSEGEYTVMVWGWDKENGITTDVMYTDFTAE